MLKINENTGLVIAEDTRSAIVAIDRAILSETRLTMSIIEASEQIGLPAAQSQKLLESMARSFDHLVAGRADMLAVVRHLNSIKGRSNLNVVDYGCPDGLGPEFWAKTDETTETAKAG